MPPTRPSAARRPSRRVRAEPAPVGARSRRRRRAAAAAAAGAAADGRAEPALAAGRCGPAGSRSALTVARLAPRTSAPSSPAGWPRDRCALGQHVRVRRSRCASSAVERLPVVLASATGVRCLGAFVMVAVVLSRSASPSCALHAPAGPLVPALQLVLAGHPRDGGDHRHAALHRRRASPALYLVQRRSEERRRQRAGGPVARLPSAAGLDRSPTAPSSSASRSGRSRSSPARSGRENGLGPLLGLGPQGDLGVHHLGRLRRLPARPGHRGLAGPQGRHDRQLIAFGCLLFNLVGVNIFSAGLHSYAEVP